MTKGNALLVVIFVCSLLARIGFLAYTNYTAEDAYITFQFSRNIAAGNGFAINRGEPVFGTTTPLLALILSVWLLFSSDVVTGSRVIAILAVASGLAFLYLAIKNKYAALVAMAAIGLSIKLIIEDMQGMEFALLFAFAMGSLYGIASSKPSLSGIMAGMILWTRIDAVVWVVSLLIGWTMLNRRHAWRFVLLASVIYLPWLVFAFLYFGSPIPMTIIAKEVAYGANKPPLPEQFMTIVRYIGWPLILAALLSVSSVIKHKSLFVLPIFIVLEALRLALSGSTFFFRYFYLLEVTFYLMATLGLSYLVSRLKLNVAVVLIIVVIISTFGVQGIQKYKDLQDNRHTTLRNMGTWLNITSVPQATILLEPLGYVGWYANRTVIDEVGLVTPRVIYLKQHGVPGSEYFRIFWPKYVVWTCGEGGTARQEISAYYYLDKIFDGHQPRTCYEVWKLRGHIALQ